MRARHGWAADWIRKMSPLVPAERRDWAEAMAAELEAIESGWQVWCWTLGSTFTLLRVSMAAAFRAEWERGVTMSRVFVAVSVLMLALFWLATPVVRQGVSLVGESWSAGLHDPLSAVTDRDVERVRAKPKSQTDPEAMVYLALNEKDVKNADVLISKAVEHEPRLGWAYALLAKEHPRDQQTRDWIQKAREYDGNNGLMSLLAAREIRLQAERAPEGQEIAPEWDAQMKQAFASPEYNDYMRERLDLQRVIMRRYETGSPISLVSVIYRVHPSNDIHLYADKLILDGNRSGDLSKYREVIGFAQRFYLGASTDLEQNVARNLLQRCMAILAPKLKGQGHDEEAEQMAFQVAAIQKYTKSLIENRSEYLLNRTASIIHLATLFSILASLMIAGAFVAWVISRLRKTSTRAATAIMTGGVMVLMSSLAIVYISYRPYQQIYAQFVDGGFVPPKVLSGFGPILNVPFFVFRMTPSFSEEVLLWQIVLVTGTGALAVIAARHLRAWRGGHAS